MINYRNLYIVGNLNNITQKVGGNYGKSKKVEIHPVVRIYPSDLFNQWKIVKTEGTEEWLEIFKGEKKDAILMLKAFIKLGYKQKKGNKLFNQ